MARTFNVPLQLRAAGTYGPFTIDGRVLGDVGAIVTIQRDVAGVWPGLATDVVLVLSFEFLYGGQWLPAGGSQYYGGVQPARFGGGNRLTESCRIEWPKVNQGGVLVPDPPDAVRATVVLAQALNIAASVAWLS